MKIISNKEQLIQVALTVQNIPGLKVLQTSDALKVKGNVFEHKDKLRKLGFTWNSKYQVWLYPYFYRKDDLSNNSSNSIVINITNRVFNLSFYFIKKTLKLFLMTVSLV